MTMTTTSTEPQPAEPYQHRMVKVRRVRDAVGAYCLDCQRVIHHRPMPAPPLVHHL